MNTAEIIARRMNQADAGCFVEAILKERLRTNYGDANRSEGLSLLEWYPSPEARADLLIQATQGDADRAVERFSEPALADHGLTRAVLEAAARRFKTARKRGAVACQGEPCGTGVGRAWGARGGAAGLQRIGGDGSGRRATEGYLKKALISSKIGSLAGSTSIPW